MVPLAQESRAADSRPPPRGGSDRSRRADVGACVGCAVAHPEPFTVEDLLPYRTAREPPSQEQAMERRKIMRKARSAKKRPLLLADLERRYRESPVF